SKTRSQGASIGVGGSGVSSLGFNQAKANTNTKQVVLTSLTGNSVNIKVKDHTQLTGSTIASVNKATDAQGNTITTDNGTTKLNHKQPKCQQPKHHHQQQIHLNRAQHCPR
uniref:hypothetical protein n=1 Tax=Candidatus Thioglobus sp. TaxID=2026721 RepID=UPI003D11D63F